MRYFWILLFILTACGAAPDETSPTPLVSEATELSCEPIVATSMENLGRVCSEVGRNEVCYGNRRIDVSLQADAGSTFAEPGDRIPIENLERLSLSPMNTANGEWGLALMEVQADLPDTLPGQNVSFLLFGGTEISPTGELDGLQAFYLRTGIGQATACDALPEDGVIIQSPEGDIRVSFSINGVRFELGSTAYLTADEEMQIRLLEGQAVVEAAGESQTIAAGQESNVPLDEAGQAVGAPSVPVAYDANSLRTLPIQNLPRPIEIAPPIQARATVTPQAETALSLIPEFASAANPDLGIFSGEISESKPRDAYSFVAEANQAIYIDAHEIEGDMRVTLIAPDKSILVDQHWLGVDYGVLVLEQAGEYRIEITAYQGSSTGEYELQFWNVPAPNLLQASISAAIPNNKEGQVFGRIPAPAMKNIYEFSAEAGQSIYVDAHAIEGDMRINLISPNGTLLLNQHWLGVDGGILNLTESGIYRLEAYGYMDAVGTYELQIWDVPAPEAFETTIAEALPENTDGIISGEIITPARRHIYNFSAEAGQSIYIDAHAIEGDMRINLVSPDGTVLLNQAWLGVDAGIFTLSESGIYRIEAYGYLDAVGTYELQIWDVPEPKRSTISIAPNDESRDGIVTGDIVVPAESYVYEFEARAGTSILLATLSREGDIRATLISPNGEILLNQHWVGVDSPVIALPESGLYILRLFGYLDGLGSYQVQVREAD